YAASASGVGRHRARPAPLLNISALASPLEASGSARTISALASPLEASGSARTAALTPEGKRAGWGGGLGLLQQVGLNWQGADALPRGRVDGVAHSGSDGGDAGLAQAARGLAGGEDG